MVTRRQWLDRAAACAALALAGRSPAAPGYPTQQIRLLVGFAAGGNFDLVARITSQWLSERLRQQVVVENKTGAGGNIATEAMIRAPADGHTLLLGGAVNAVNATLYEKLPFDFERDAAPVAGVVRFANVITVGASFPATTLAEFMAYARANPGRLTQGSSGNGTTQHLAGELFKEMSGIDFVHVPYRGASQAITDLLGGQVQVLFEPLPASMPFIRSGKLRALGVTTAARSSVLPDVPSVSESLPGYEASGWTGLFAPRGTSADAVETLNAAISALLIDPSTRTRFAELGATAMPGSPGDFGRFVATEVDKWGRVIRAGRIKPT